MSADEWELPLVEKSSTKRLVQLIDMGNGKFVGIHGSAQDEKDITLSDALGSHGRLLTCTLHDLIRPRGLHEWVCQNPLCRKNFWTENPRQIYCSRECYLQAFIWRRRLKEFKLYKKKCSYPNCEREFIAKRIDARFCCPAHQKAARRKAMGGDRKKTIKRNINENLGEIMTLPPTHRILTPSYPTGTHDK